MRYRMAGEKLRRWCWPSGECTFAHISIIFNEKETVLIDFAELIQFNERIFDVNITHALTVRPTHTHNAIFFNRMYMCASLSADDHRSQSCFHSCATHTNVVCQPNDGNERETSNWLTDQTDWRRAQTQWQTEIVLVLLVKIAVKHTPNENKSTKWKKKCARSVWLSFYFVAIFNVKMVVSSWHNEHQTFASFSICWVKNKSINASDKFNTIDDCISVTCKQQSNLKLDFVRRICAPKNKHNHENSIRNEARFSSAFHGAFSFHSSHFSLRTMLIRIVSWRQQIFDFHLHFVIRSNMLSNVLTFFSRFFFLSLISPCIFTDEGKRQLKRHWKIGNGRTEELFLLLENEKK